MEDIWKEISLNSAFHSTPSLSLHHQQQPQLHSLQYQNFPSSISTNLNSSSFREMNLQDFLSGSSKNSSSSATKHPEPLTAVSLNCGQFTTYIKPTSSFDTSDASSSVVINGVSNPVGLATNCLKKRGPEQRRGEILDSHMDQKKRRLMRNRESAARSRARKLVYTHEMEGEVDRLASENRKIKKQYEQLLRIKKEAQIAVTANCKLKRTSSAPF